MGLLDRLRRRPTVADMQGIVVRTAVLDGEVRWSQPFHWGLLMAFDDRHDWEVPEGVGGSQVCATRTFLAVSVLHAQDVELDDSASPDELLPEANVEVVLRSGPLEGEVDFAGVLECPSNSQDLWIGVSRDLRLTS